eukprot:COSAG02_NODE_18140_length_958_cov_1.272410_1_plen_82_part_00
MICPVISLILPVVSSLRLAARLEHGITRCVHGTSQDEGSSCLPEVYYSNSTAIVPLLCIAVFYYRTLEYRYCYEYTSAEMY